MSADLPSIQHISGTLHALTHEAHVGANKRPSYGIYRFLIGHQPYVMYAGENFGNALPFLAEGDQVDIAAHDAPLASDDPHRLVYAMRNLEDDRVYVSHRVFRFMHTDIGPVGVGPGQRTPMLKLIGWLLLITWLIFVGIVYTTGTPQTLAELPELATVIGGGMLIVWLVFALPLLFLDTRWRLGKPTRRQRILDRVYATLNLGTPFAPTARIEEL